ncbi:MAG: acetyl-coenzyme A synthetase N-terminal domain-containing protein, partial [Syntrophothermus sp.]
MSPPAADPLWEPSAELVDRSRMTEFMRWLEAERGLAFDGYHELQRWSADDLEGFWAAIWDFFEVRADGEPSPVLAAAEMPGARWLGRHFLSHRQRIDKSLVFGLIHRAVEVGLFLALV